MNRLWRRGRVWMLLAIGAALIALATWTLQRTGLSWITIAVAVIAAGCVAAMGYLWWVSARTARTLDETRIARSPTKPKTRQP
jgi:predicted lysophospholipase L1 biosynthesis ABC-type transport system permease subunit